MPTFSTITPVTEDTFLVWKRKFELELWEEKKIQNKGLFQEDDKIKITGRQYFERRLNLDQPNETEEEEDDAEAINFDEFRREENLQEEVYSQYFKNISFSSKKKKKYKKKKR
jgi:hypothetical protein